MFPYVELDGRRKSNSQTAAGFVITACFFVGALFLAAYFAYVGPPRSF